MQRRLNERVDAEEALPLIPYGMGLVGAGGCFACVLARAEARRGSVTAGDILRSVAGSDEGVECIGSRAAVKVAAHALVGGEVTGYLEELHAE